MIRIAPQFIPPHHGEEIHPTRRAPMLAVGLTCYGCFAPSAPATPNYAQINQETLAAQANLAPSQFQLEAQFQPAYSDLSLQNLNTILKGSEGGVQNYNYTTTALKNGFYDAKGNLVRVGKYNPLTGGAPPPAGAVYRAKGTQYNVSDSITTKPSEGLLSLMAKQNSDQRANDLADVSKYGVQAHDAMLSANPESAALLAKLNVQANQGLDAGSGLTPDEMRAMQQQSRAAAAARGMGGTNGALGDELLKQFDLGQQLLRQRQAFAQSLIGTNQGVIGDPFMQILGRPATAIALGQNQQQMAGPQIFNPQAGMGMAQSNYAAQSQLAAATPSTFSTIMGGVGAVGGLMGGIGGMMGKK